MRFTSGHEIPVPGTTPRRRIPPWEKEIRDEAADRRSYTSSKKKFKEVKEAEEGNEKRSPKALPRKQSMAEKVNHSSFFIARC